MTISNAKWKALCTAMVKDGKSKTRRRKLRRVQKVLPRSVVKEEKSKRELQQSELGKEQSERTPRGKVHASRQRSQRLGGSGPRPPSGGLLLSRSL